MKRRTIVLLFVVCLLTIGFLGFIKVNKDFLQLWNANSISVTTDKNLNTEFAKIEHGISVNTISRPNDTHLFSDRKKYDVLFDKSFRNKPTNEYGENDFLITYADTV